MVAFYLHNIFIVNYFYPLKVDANFMEMDDAHASNAVQKTRAQKPLAI